MDYVFVENPECPKSIHACLNFGHSGISFAVSILFYRPDNKLKHRLLYQNQILRQYTWAAGGCTYTRLLGVQMDGDCAASSQLVYMCGGVYIAVAEGNQAELPRTGGGDIQAATRFIRDRCPTHIHTVSGGLRFHVVVEHPFGIRMVDGDTAALDTVDIRFSGTSQVGNLRIFSRHFKRQADTRQRFDDGRVGCESRRYHYCAVRVEFIVLHGCPYCFTFVIQ